MRFLMQPWPWWGLVIPVTYTLSRFAGWCMDRGPLTDTDWECSQIDDELNAAASLVGSRLDVVDHLIDEDRHWSGVESEWHAYIDSFGVQQ